MRRIILTCWLLLATGCGTMMQWDVGPAIYGGVRFDLYLFHGTNMETEFWFGLLVILDMPFSFVFDTVLLPFIALLTLL